MERTPESVCTKQKPNSIFCSVPCFSKVMWLSPKQPSVKDGIWCHFSPSVYFLFHLCNMFQICCFFFSWIVLLLCKRQWSVKKIKNCPDAEAHNSYIDQLDYFFKIAIEPVNLFCCLALMNKDYFACVRLHCLKGKLYRGQVCSCIFLWQIIGKVCTRKAFIGQLINIEKHCQPGKNHIIPIPFLIFC